MTIAQEFRTKINKAQIEEKAFLAKQARDIARFDFGNLISKLVFSDNSKLEINAKFKAKVIK